MDDIDARYEVTRTAEFIRGRAYTRVALQFPDEMLRDAAAVARALRRELAAGGGGGGGVKLFVMADTAYNSCCVDEVGASHIDAQCVVHYGHACMSPTSNLPAFFVFGKSPLDTNACGRSLLECLRESDKRILVLYGLEYAHALSDLKKVVVELYKSHSCSVEVQYADVQCSVMSPSPAAEREHTQSDGNTCGDDLSIQSDGVATFVNNCCDVEGSTRKYSLGGLTWAISIDDNMEDYLLYWIGQDNSAFANIVLTFNKCDIVRYDSVANQPSRDVSHLMKILRRRYYLVEKAKDASIVGILVGTLGVAGYLHIIEQMKDLIKAAGKKSYTLVMGRPNSAKLANFPECEVFVYVSCAQTALLDSKDFLAPVITPFEAVLAFSRGREWTGEYLLDFKDLITTDKPEISSKAEEARFSFIKGGYVEDNGLEENEEHSETSLALAEVTEKALSIKNQNNDAVLYQGGARSAIDYLKARSYRGLTGQYEGPAPDSVLTGRTGRAASYSHEKTKSAE
ncbi:2-(3-amino-3-carboxypropyl)histidine synthase subunit 2 isoform X1 [Oryza brachyantha]|uniref:2-(3-amino-3-carboxypropyl)histidine synthase subunit 2 isoform X1 n=1 Tax=Oryza brachyantha TaxID=4533 RepID=UPI001ADC2227|nr:2-(3-amino-3-carboxypropyl)histidine synthase subunit 2 isoform X1 [Oryza brachyantha]